jgi:hypothetical protein
LSTVSANLSATNEIGDEDYFDKSTVEDFPTATICHAKLFAATNNRYDQVWFAKVPVHGKKSDDIVDGVRIAHRIGCTIKGYAHELKIELHLSEKSSTPG